MLEGAYAIRVTTPFGRKHGTAVMAEKDGRVLMSVTMEERTIRLEGRTTDDPSTFFSSGSFAANKPFRLLGSVSGDALRAQFLTGIETYEVTGTRIQIG